jgi:hypothetical protein
MMAGPFLNVVFDKPEIDPRLRWYCEPACWKVESNRSITAARAERLHGKNLLCRHFRQGARISDTVWLNLC